MSSGEPRTNTKSPKAETKSSGDVARPEPLPEWNVAINTWSEFWEIHYIGFGCAFAAMALFSCFCLYRIHRAGKAMTLRRYFFAVCLMMMLFCFSRSLYLLLDPYESHSVLTLPVIVVRILFALGYPCLTSAFSLIHFAFIEVKKIRTIVNRLQNIKFLSSVISLHFLIVVVIYVVITFAPTFARLLILCQSILISWWITLAICFMYSGCQVSWEAKISKQFFVKQKSKRLDSSSTSSKTTYSSVRSSDHPASQLSHTYYRPEPSDERKSKAVSKIARISGVVVVLGVVSAALELYSLFAVYDLYSLSKTYVDAWPWWAYETCGRILEFLLCLVIAYVIFPSLKAKSKRNRSASNSTNMTRNTTNRQSKLSMEALDVVVTSPGGKGSPKAELRK